MKPLDEAVAEAVPQSDAAGPTTPERELLAADERAELDRLVEALPAEFREVVVLRELEELSYREIAEITAVPVGTVMSRLSRARARLRAEWRRRQGKENERGM